jgi:hypothetical protein
VRSAQWVRGHAKSWLGSASTVAVRALIEGGVGIAIQTASTAARWRWQEKGNMHHRLILWGSFIATVLAAGCAGTPGAKPHDMSVAGHEQAAADAEAAAQQHAKQYDATASVDRDWCPAARNDPTLVSCWTSNPTKEHRVEAERMRKAAADHRAASQALRDAEASACAGIAEADRDTSPLQRPAIVTGVAELHTSASTQSPAPGLLVGAAVTIRAVPGLTKEYLQRLVSCHVARNATMGHSMPEMATCPLAVKGARATVESAHGGFVVEVRSDDSAAAAEILRRARTLEAGAAQ